MGPQKVTFTKEVKYACFKSPPKPYNSTPEGAIIAKGISTGFNLRQIRGGWVEFVPHIGTWHVYMVFS